MKVILVVFGVRKIELREVFTVGVRNTSFLAGLFGQIDDRLRKI